MQHTVHFVRSVLPTLLAHKFYISADELINVMGDIFNTTTHSQELMPTIQHSDINLFFIEVKSFISTLV